MKYMRNHHNINVSGSKNKKSLINNGYYHLYKGYRYINNDKNKAIINDFSDLEAMINYDIKLKQILYPIVMQFETITKNRVLNLLLEKYKTDRFEEIYQTAMVGYKTVKNKDRDKAIKSRLKVKDKINSTITNSYGKSPIITHFYDNDTYVPLWGIFEVLMFGEFANFIKTLDDSLKVQIMNDMGIKSTYDSKGKLSYQILYMIKSLRNSIAHNNVIYDLRFVDSKIDSTIPILLSSETGIQNISFDNIFDYIILLVFILKHYDYNRKNLKQLVKEYESALNQFYKESNIYNYNKIVRTDTKKKIKELLKYI